MDKKVKETILQVIKECSDSEGWAKQATVCLKCKQKGVDLKEYGKGHASNVFVSLSDYVESDKDSNGLPTLKLKEGSDKVTCDQNTPFAEGATLKGKTGIKDFEVRNAYRKFAKEPEEWVSFEKIKCEIGYKGTIEDLTNKCGFLQHHGDKVRVHNISRYEIVDDIYFNPKKNSFPNGIQKLREMALYEKWDDKLLENYICYTYARVKDQKKIAYSEDQLYSCWNTGLVDFRYEPIYCYLTRKSSAARWMFRDFCIFGEDLGKEMNNNISDMPKCAEYFLESDLLCQPTDDNLSVDKDHIITEHPSRLPFEWLKQFLGEDASRIEGEKEPSYEKRLSELLNKRSYCNMNLQTYLKQSVDEAIKRCQWNYKTAIPYYDPNSKSLGWFLPLCVRTTEEIEGKERTHLSPFAALVVTKGKSGRFQGETIYRLSWAYRCARLVCRPDSDWLVPTDDDSDNED